MWHRQQSKRQQLRHTNKSRSAKSRRTAEQPRSVEQLERRNLLTGYVQQNLVADQAGTALVQDPALIAPWGVASAPDGGSFWIADSGSSSATLYQGDVSGSGFSKTPINIALPGGLPTGDVYAGSTGAFSVTDANGNSVPARFIFASLNGNLIATAAPPAPGSSLQTLVGQGQIVAHEDGAVFTGLAIGSSNGQTYLYAADFQHGQVDVFDTSYHLVKTLSDTGAPAGYSPFNVAVINGQLYVSYAAYTTTSIQNNDNDNDESDQTDNSAPQNDAHGNGNGNGNGHGNGNGNGNGNGHGNGNGNGNGNGDGNGGGEQGNGNGNGNGQGNGNGNGNGNGGGPGNGGPHGGPGGGQNNDDDDDEGPGPGQTLVRILSTSGGFIDLFNADGSVTRLTTGGPLNAPWGMALAPSGFGQFGGDLLVGNFGDGRISAFSLSGGAANLAGQLTNPAGAPVAIPHLLGLAFGNGVSAGDSNTLYFTSAPSGAGSGGGGATTAPSLVVLDPSGNGALTASGNGAVDVSDGGTIAVDSTSGSAISLDGNGQVVAGTIDIVGGYNANGHANLQGTVDTGATSVADPLASLATPNISQLTTYQAVNVSGNTQVTLSPGVYTGGIQVSGQATVRLMPGIYYLQGGGLSVTGQGSIFGQGVTIYNAPLSANDGISVTGQGSISISAPIPGTPLANPINQGIPGVAIFEARGAGSPISVDGNGSINIVGALYAPQAVLQAAGNGRINVLSNPAGSVAAEIIVGDVSVVGNGTVDVASNSDHVPSPIGGVHGLFGSLQVGGNSLLTTGATLHATEGATFTGAVAAFGSPTSGAVASDYTATIDWGDGSSASQASVVATANGGFLVLSSHQYAEDGSDTIHVTINGNGGSTTVTEQAQVADAPLVALSLNSTVQLNQNVNNATLATFSDLGGPDVAGDYTATVDWGDGTTSPGTPVVNSDGTISVLGSHSYTAAGQYTLRITLNDEGGSSTTAFAEAAIGNVDADDFFVAQAFQNILGRSVDTATLQYFVNALEQGLTRAAFASLLTHSDEYFHDKIDADYQHYLGRDADDSGLAYWTSQLRNGVTDEQLAAFFIGSPEYFEHSGGANLSWVRQMYFDLLGRAPDTAGEVFWVNLLNAGGSRSQVALGFAASPEREGIMVSQDYLDFLGRQPGQSEINGWVGSFEHGLTNEQVISGFVASPEYFGDHNHLQAGHGH